MRKLVQSVTAFSVERMAGSGDDHHFGMRDCSGQGSGIVGGNQDIFTAGNDHGGYFDLPEPCSGIEGVDRRQLRLEGSGRLGGRGKLRRAICRDEIRLLLPAAFTEKDGQILGNDLLLGEPGIVEQNSRDGPRWSCTPKLRRHGCTPGTGPGYGVES